MEAQTKYDTFRFDELEYKFDNSVNRHALLGMKLLSFHRMPTIKKGDTVILIYGHKK